MLTLMMRTMTIIILATVTNKQGVGRLTQVSVGLGSGLLPDLPLKSVLLRLIAHQ